MFNGQNLIEQNKTANNMQKLFGIIVLTFFIATFVLMLTMIPAFASGMGGGGASGGALNQVMDTVLGIIKTASLYVGIIIILWGVFQIILALRREDSEGVSKQIITIVVGGVLVGFGTLADQLYAALT